MATSRHGPASRPVPGRPAPLTPRKRLARRSGRCAASGQTRSPDSGESPETGGRPGDLLERSGKATISDGMSGTGPPGRDAGAGARVADPGRDGLGDGRERARGQGGPVMIGDEPVVIGSDPACQPGDRRSPRLAPARGDPPDARRASCCAIWAAATAPSSGGSRSRRCCWPAAPRSGWAPPPCASRWAARPGGWAGWPAQPVRDEELDGAPVALRPGHRRRRPPCAGCSPCCARLAPTELTITLIGETGTGKDVLARAIHEASARAGQPVRGVRLRRGGADADRERAVRPREGRLHRRGRRAPGRLRARPRRHPVPRRDRRAAAGPAAQAAARAGAALRAPGGRRRGHRRSTCASSPPPTAISRSEVRKSAFREDLFFRLSAAMLQVPPLRERPRGPARAGRPTSWRRPARPLDGRPPRRWRCWPATTGRATCAS